MNTEVNKIKNAVLARDQGLFDKSGRRLSPGKSIHNDFNSATVNKLNKLGNVSAFMAQVDEKLKELQSTSFKSLVFKPSTYKARKRKQNKKERYQTKVSQDHGESKTRVLQTVLPRINHGNVDITIGVEDKARLSRREAKVLHETLKLDNRFSEAAKAYISDSLPPSLASSDGESISDSDSDQ